MSDNISLEATKIVNQSVKAFTNLLKEFPKNGADNFIYDESTLKKIASAAAALAEMARLVKQKTTSLGEPERDAVKESFATLSRLMAELPRKPADEFLYDRMIHQLVEDARETITKLSRLFP